MSVTGRKVASGKLGKDLVAGTTLWLGAAISAILATIVVPLPFMAYGLLPDAFNNLESLLFTAWILGVASALGYRFRCILLVGTIFAVGFLVLAVIMGSMPYQTEGYLAMWPEFVRWSASFGLNAVLFALYCRVCNLRRT